MGNVKSLDDLPNDLVAAAAAVDPKYLVAPTEDYDPSLSPLENYAREQKPAPIKLAESSASILAAERPRNRQAFFASVISC